MSKTLNQGRNAIVDALADGKDIQIQTTAVGTDGSDAQASQTGLQDAISGARYSTSNTRRATGRGRFVATIPESSDADNETLRELVVEIDDGGTELAIARVPFADTLKESGSELIIETDGEVLNP